MAGLSILKIKAMKEPGRFGDGRGLYLQVRGPENKSWLLRYKMSGRARAMGLGPYPEVGLAEARDAALEARRLILKGIDPLEQRKDRTLSQKVEKAADRTFREVAIKYVADQRAGWKNPKHADQWMNTLQAHAFPTLGSKGVASISTDDVLAVLRPIWSETPETASRLRGRLEAILDAAVAMKLRLPGVNPASWKGNLKSLLAPVARMKRAAGMKSHPSLPWAQMPLFMMALAAEEGLSAVALRLAILTAARSGEVRGAIWSEIDLDNGLWIIPPERMKAGRIHRVPLSPAAVTLLQSVPRQSADPHALIFPGTTRRDGVRQPLSDMSLSSVVRRMNEQAGAPRWIDQLGQPVVPHGFRSTFRDWISETTSFPHEVAEAALAHTVKSKTEAAYSRSDHLKRRREMMVAWAVFIEEGRS